MLGDDELVRHLIIIRRIWVLAHNEAIVALAFTNSQKEVHVGKLHESVEVEEDEDFVEKRHATFVRASKKRFFLQTM